jgi:hypothetical protein
MYQQTSLLFYKFLGAGVSAIAFLVLISALVAAIGANTVLDARTHPFASVSDPGAADNPNLVATDLSAFSDGVQHAMLSTGSALYGGCRSITIATARSGRAVGHDSAVALKSTGHGLALATHGVGTGVMFTRHRLPHWPTSAQNSRSKLPSCKRLS